LYLALRELKTGNIPSRLIRVIFELRTLAINGEYPNFFQCYNCGSAESLDYFDKKRYGMLCANCHGKKPEKELVNPSALYALQYILTAKEEQLFRFQVTEEVLEQMEEIVHSYMKSHIDKRFKSLEFLENPLM
jgi:DNA repair protein RecO (recombination protein O)